MLPAAPEYSTEQDVRAVGWAKRFIDARAQPGDRPYAATWDEFFIHFSALREDERNGEVLGLIHALVRFGVTLSLWPPIAGETREEVLERTYQALAESSIDHEPESWADKLCFEIRGAL